MSPPAPPPEQRGTPLGEVLGMFAPDLNVFSTRHQNLFPLLARAPNGVVVGPTGHTIIQFSKAEEQYRQTKLQQRHAARTAQRATESPVYLATLEAYAMKKNPPQQLFTFQGEVMGAAVHCMLDSGAACNFISTTWAETHGLEVTMLPEGQGPRIQLADGHMKQCRQQWTGKLRLGPLRFEVRAFVFPLSSFDVILGMPWLNRHNPEICWENRIMKLNGGSVIITGEQPNEESKTALFAAAEEEKEARFYDQVGFKEANDIWLDMQNTHPLFAATTDDTKAGPVVVDVEDLLQEFRDVMPTELPNELPPRREIDHKIELVPGSTPPSQYPRRLNPAELRELKIQLDDLLQKGLIRPSVSPFGAPIVFVDKKGPDARKRMCIDYRELNKITIKNKAPLPRIDELLDRLHYSRVFSKIDLRSGYHQVRIAEGHEPQTCFTTRYGSFEWLVLPFGLCNAPSTFQTLMNSIFFKEGLDEFVVIYLDDILVFSKDAEQHRTHLRKVFEVLRKHQLYAHPGKSEYGRSQVSWVGMVLSDTGISMDQKKVQAVVDWPSPSSLKEVQQFLGLAGYYRKFIQGFARTAAPLYKIRKDKASFEWTAAQQAAFEKLKVAITTAPTLVIPQPDKPFTITTDASKVAIGAVLSQDQGHGLQPVAFISRQLRAAEVNYPTHEQELLAIKFALEQWRHHLCGTLGHKVLTDHNPLMWFSKQKTLTPRQARWNIVFQEYDIYIEYIPGKSNTVADALSRRPDLYAGIMSLSNDDLLLQIKQQYGRDEESQKIIQLIKTKPCPYYWHEGMIRYKGRIYVPHHEGLREAIMYENHDTPLAGHLGQDKTYHAVCRGFYWPKLADSIAHYVRGCSTCQVTKAVNQPPIGSLRPLPIPAFPFEWVSMDFVTGLPVTPRGYDALLVFVDKLSKYTIAVPTTTEIDAPETARLYFNHVVCQWGLPKHLISDRGPQFRANFWQALHQHLGTRLNLSSAYHPQTDGQTERANRTIEEMLRAFCRKNQTDWDLFVKPVCFAYNQSTNPSTGYSPFYATHGYHPVNPATLHLGEVTNQSAFELAEKIQGIVKEVQNNMAQALRRQKNYADQHRRDLEFEEGQHVYLDTKDLSLEAGQKRKLSAKWVGPFQIIKKLSAVSYTLALPSAYSRLHPTFHISKLKLCPEHLRGGEEEVTQIEPLGPLEGTTDFFVVNQLTNRRWRWIPAARPTKRNAGKWIPEYEVDWRGYPKTDRTWEPIHCLTRPAIKQMRQVLDTEIDISCPKPTAPPDDPTKEAFQRCIRKEEEVNASC